MSGTTSRKASRYPKPERRIEGIEARLQVLEGVVEKITETAPKIDPDTLYTAAEACGLLRCGKTNIYDLWTTGELAVTSVGTGRKGKRVLGSDLIAFRESRTMGGPSAKIKYKYLKRLNDD